MQATDQHALAGHGSAKFANLFLNFNSLRYPSYLLGRTTRRRTLMVNKSVFISLISDIYA